MQDKKIFNFKSYLLEQETLEKYGYTTKNIKPKSAKFVAAICRFCGEKHYLRMCFYTQAGSACHKECKLKEQAFFSPFKEKLIQKKIKIKKNKFLKEILTIFKNIDPNIEITEIEKNIFLFNNSNFAISYNENELCSEFDFESKIARNININKTKKYFKKGIRIFHIYENIWAERKYQIINFVKTIILKNNIKIDARKCNIIIENKNKDTEKFLEENHIQGKSQYKKNFCLYYKEELVAVLSHSRHHRQGFDEIAVLSRLCFKDGYNIRGGASKLFSAYKKWAKENNYDKIISWSDNSWTEGNIYKVLNFKLEEEIKPDYFYWNKEENKYQSKQSQRKRNNGCPENVTEREYCLSKNLYRIYDCGKKRWGIVV